MEFETNGTGTLEAARFPQLPRSLQFEELLTIIGTCISSAIDSPYTYEQLEGPGLSRSLIRPFVLSLRSFESESGNDSSSRSRTYSFRDQHRGILTALMILRQEFQESTFDVEVATGYFERGVCQARSIACELIAARLLYYVDNDWDRVELLTWEQQPEPVATSSPSAVESGISGGDSETSPLLDTDDSSLDISQYVQRSALQIAVEGRAKEFLSARPVESILLRIWSGRIVFWDRTSANCTKSAQFYHPSFSSTDRQNSSDMFTRLKVPRYRAFIMATNYAMMLVLFYLLLFSASETETQIGFLEIVLNVWFFGFVKDEFDQVYNSRSFEQYISDYWSFVDLSVIALFLAFFALRSISYLTNDFAAAELAFDILSLEALLLVPRFFSFLVVFPYYGTLLPCLKQLVKEFLKFSTLILILYLGFLSTFTFLGRDSFTVHEMFWLVIRVFFGASTVGLDRAPQISELFGLPLMLVFVIMTQNLLMVVLVSILSNKFGSMMKNARQEYISMFSEAVMETVNSSDQVTYFYPPLNLLALAIAPLEAILGKSRHRKLQIALFKATHWPLAGLIYIYEVIAYYYDSKRVQRNSRSLYSARVSLSYDIETLFSTTPSINPPVSKKKSKMRKILGLKIKKKV